jgi:hypothetical protein
LGPELASEDGETKVVVLMDHIRLSGPTKMEKRQSSVTWCASSLLVVGGTFTTVSLVTVFKDPNDAGRLIEWCS